MGNIQKKGVLDFISLHSFFRFLLSSHSFHSLFPIFFLSQYSAVAVKNTSPLELSAVSTLSCITPILTGHCQTIAVCGVQPDEIARLCACERVRGADRIVPFGHTLDFELTWDGFNLIENMSRRISC